MLMERDLAARLGQETVRFLDAGAYVTPSGRCVDIRDAVDQAALATVTYPPEQPLPDSLPSNHSTQITVTNESTLVAGWRLHHAGRRPVALNFASATSPGGGFLTGARAQEESLARSSGLYACLRDHDLYAFHRGRGDAVYTDVALYSPNVPVIRLDDGTLLDEPWPLSLITCAAINAKAVRRSRILEETEIREVMGRRIRRVLAIAHLHGHETLILGAWGCGAFGLATPLMADLFREALAGPFRGVFREVVFAILDWSPDHHFIGPFVHAFR